MCKHYHTHNTSIKHKIFLQWFSIASLPKCFPWPWHILTNTVKRMRGKGKLVWLSPYGALWFWNKPSGYLDSIKQSHVAPMAARILVHSHPCNECSSLPHAQLMYCSVIGQTEKVQLEWHIDFNTRSLKLSILEMLVTFLVRVIITQIHNAAKQAFSDPSTCKYQTKVLNTTMFHRRGRHLSHPLQNSSFRAVCPPNTLTHQRLEYRPRGEMISRAGLEMSHSMTNWAGLTRGCCRGVDTRSRESKPPCDCRHPPTLLTEEHASDGLSIRKCAPFHSGSLLTFVLKLCHMLFFVCGQDSPQPTISRMWVLLSQCGEPFPHSLIFLVRTEPLHGWSGLGMLL